MCELRRIRDKGYKLKQEGFRLDLRRNLFSKRTAQLQSRLSREVVPKALSNLAWHHNQPCLGQEVGLGTS